MATTTKAPTGGRKRAVAEPARILHWIFVKGAKALTCEIRVNAMRSHDVCVVPHWDLSSAVVQRFDRPANALWRHAEIVRRFQDDGWTLVRRRRDGYSQAAL
jgi:hypothetical protein